MSAHYQKNWQESNQAYLMAALHEVLAELLRHLSVASTENREIDAAGMAYISTEEARRSMSSSPAIETLTATFGLSSFERKILLMCAGMELDAHFHHQIVKIAGYPPTFSLALSAFSDAHWSAVSPSSPLRYWGLIDMREGQVVTQNTIRIDERILHYLTGVAAIDERLRVLTEPVSPGMELPSSHQVKAEHILHFFQAKTTQYPMPVVCLTGNEKYAKSEIAVRSAREMGFNLYRMPASAVPTSQKEINEIARLWNRETALIAAALLLDCSSIDNHDRNRLSNINAWIEAVQGLQLITTTDWVCDTGKAKLEIAVEKPTPAEQLRQWKNNLPQITGVSDDYLARIVAQFNLNTNAIDTICKALDDTSNNLAEKTLWKTCCLMTRPKLNELAQRIETKSTLLDIVLPPEQKQLLQDIILQVRHRNQVYQDWGFAAKSSRGLGISALFVGESGTGKTMATEVLANELELDLYRIDLSQVVNKYIGETEKNLKQIFDAAEDGGAILLFDEADALFGKRSEVKDSHDRFGNQQVSYLLQRMESYRGLAVMTSNMKKAIDPAFMRRIRFVMQFPYPDATQRAAIWQGIFPEGTPKENLNIDKLSRLNIAGGNIRNIALNAAFYAAHEKQPVQMRHIALAVKNEYTKLEKNLSLNEVSGW